MLKVNVAGTAFIYSTYIGGGDNDFGIGIMADSDGNAYVTGYTYSTDFPTVNPIQPINAGVCDVFILKLNSAGSDLNYSTYIGGSGEDNGHGIDIDVSGNAYVTGYTESTDFITTFGTIQRTKAGGGDSFVLKINPLGNGRVYSTFLGGGGDEIAIGIAVDGIGNAYVTGYTESTDFHTSHPFQAINSGEYDAFLSKINVAGNVLLLSTYFGGEYNDAAYSIALDARGGVLVAGGTYSIDFPTLNAFQPDYSGDCDAFILKFDEEGSGLHYATYVGGGGDDEGQAISLDAIGNVYVTGYTYSTDFPTSAGSFQDTFAGERDVFVLKLNADGSSLIYSTYIGGEWDENGIDIAVDDLGNAYVTGYTNSTDFPVSNPLQAANRGYYDAFVLKLNPSGNGLLYSTYVGGLDSDAAYSIDFDEDGNVFVTGYTYSRDFPIVLPSLQTIYAGEGDAFVLKVDPTGNSLVYSTFIGGKGDDVGSSIAVDAMGNAYIAGYTNSTDFPIANPLQALYGGAYDAIILKLNPTGTALIYSTFIGGGLDDMGIDIAIDDIGNAYVTGYTNSTDFPTSDPFQAVKGSMFDAFVLKLNAIGSTLIYSTFLGGSEDDIGYSIAIDESGNIYVTGYTFSVDFPTATPLQPETGGDYDAFVLKLNAAGSMLIYSTYLGGSDSDFGLGIALGVDGYTYITGSTYSIDFPTTIPLQSMNGGYYDAFILKLGSFNVPSVPLDPTAIPGDGTVILNWSVPTNNGGYPIDYYIVYRDGNDVGHPGGTSITFTGLTNGVTYAFSVAAHNSLGSVPSLPPSRPPLRSKRSSQASRSTSSVTAGDGMVTLSWSAPTSGGGGIDYYIVFSNGEDVKHSTSLSCEVDGLTNGVEYSFTVAAHNVAGTGPGTAVEQATPKASSSDGSGGFDMMIILGVVVAIAAAVLVFVFVVKGRRSKASMPSKPAEPMPPIPPMTSTPPPLPPIQPTVETIRYCPWCGQKTGEEFCGNCGRRVE